MKLNREKLLILMAERKMTQCGLAIEAGVSDHTIMLAKRGKNMRTDTIGRIAIALGVPAADIALKEEDHGTAC